MALTGLSENEMFDLDADSVNQAVMVFFIPLYKSIKQKE